ncbi:hypothetical protein AAC387_Pa11g0294 [Persea americana]
MDGSEALGGPLAAWRKLPAASGFEYCRLLGDGLNVCCFPLLLVAAFVVKWGALLAHVMLPVIGCCYKFASLLLA